MRRLLIALGLFVTLAAPAAAQMSFQPDGIMVNPSLLKTPLTIQRDGITTTSTDALTLQNTTASDGTTTAQYSPRMKWCGTAWNSVGSASETDCWAIENRPATNAGATTHALTFLSSIAGAGYTVLGNVDQNGTVNMQQFSAANSSYFQWSGRSRMYSPSDGVITFFNNGQTGFTRHNYGGVTSSFPAWGISGTTITQQLADGTSGGALASSSANITVGSGTGVTVNDAGSLKTEVYKVTVLSTNFIANATTADVTLATLPAKTAIAAVVADLTQTFACTATCTTATLSMTCGKTAGGAEYLLSFDADAATGQFGITQATIGASLKYATPPATLLGDLPAWASTTAVQCRLTSGTGAVGTGSATNLSQGSITFYLTTTRMP
jgi:hypothetical protein